MADKRDDTPVTGLNDAYAIEQSLVETMERRVGHMQDMPDAQTKIRQHIELSKDQAEWIKGCIEQLGSKLSHAKSALGNMMVHDPGHGARCGQG